ncbi:Ran-specific GTPase-activating protein 1 [Ceratobasidium sp. AG-Ba]|nr:Ran-specific GTPase-activating protein 1 [Ceratobasidium sp. AG-Ba]
MNHEQQEHMSEGNSVLSSRARDDIRNSPKSSPPASPSANAPQETPLEEPRPAIPVEQSTTPSTTLGVSDEHTPVEANKTLVDATAPPSIRNLSHRSDSHSGSDGDASDKEHSRKRKLSSRSSTANEAAVRLHSKRPKESDVPEREEDFEELADTTISKPTQVFGFGSFASAKSPFATGEQKTSATTAIPPSKTERSHSDAEKSQSPPSDVPSPSVALVNAQSASGPPRGGGFAVFAAASPFQRSQLSDASSTIAPSEQRDSLAGPVRRSKSPVGKHQAFGQYSTGVSRFGNLGSRKMLHDDAPGQNPNDTRAGTGETAEFENMLKSKGEDVLTHPTTKPEIAEVTHNTGEEEDLTIFQTRAKLYTQDETFAYKERGTGVLKLNVRRTDGEGARIVMRAEGVLRLLLNMSLYPGLICELGPDPKFVKVAEITTHERKLHAIKVGNAKLAQDLYDHLMENTPDHTVTPSSEVVV